MKQRTCVDMGFSQIPFELQVLRAYFHSIAAKQDDVLCTQLKSATQEKRQAQQVKV